MRDIQKMLYRVLPKHGVYDGTRVSATYTPAPQQQRIRQKFIQGRSIRGIALEENKARETVTKIVRSSETRNYVNQAQLAFCARLDDVLDAMVQGFKNGKRGGWLAYQCLKDAGIIPSNEMRHVVPGTAVVSEAAVPLAREGRIVMKEKQRAALYLRVSTAEQNTEGQEAELRTYAAHRGWEIVATYKDMISGATNSRPALDRLMADAKRRKFDLVAVWRFDRLARSVSHLLSALETFHSLGIEFISLQEAIDTSTPTGKMTFTVLGAVAELERALIAERVRMGIQNARKKGKRLGRPPIRKLNQQELVAVRADRATRKLSLRQLAKKYGTSVWAMQKAVFARDVAA